MASFKVLQKIIQLNAVKRTPWAEEIISSLGLLSGVVVVYELIKHTEGIRTVLLLLWLLFGRLLKRILGLFSLVLFGQSLN